MAYEESLKSISLDADASLGVYTGPPGAPGSADPNYGPALFRFVKVTGDHKVGKAVAATDPIIGIAQNKPQNVGMATTVAISGVSMCFTGTGGVTAGSKVAPDANGAAVNDGTNGKCIALATTTSAGVLVPVLIRL